MVRTYPAVPSILQPARVVAWSAALAVHLIALMLLLIPATYQALPLPRDKVQVRIIEQVPAPAPLPPPPLIVPTPTPPAVTRAPAPTVPPALPLATTEIVPTAALVEPATDLPALPAVADNPSVPVATGAQLQYRSAPPPAYPITALRNQEQGTVLLRVEVDVDGRPSAVSVERSSGSRALDQAARQQVLRQWRFVPAERDGAAVAAIGLVPISFSLPE